MSYQTVVAAFDTAAHAQAAVEALKAGGFHADDISIFGKNRVGLRDPGLWQRMFGGGLAQHEADVYSQSLDRGGMIVSVRVPDSEVAHATGILDIHRPIDVHDRAVTTGIAPCAKVEAAVASIAAKPIVAEQKVAASPKLAEVHDEVLRLAEEQLQVGKRMIETGMTRVRRFVTEKEVSADVTLYEEHAEVLRRAVADPKYIEEIDWADDTIEIRETAEQALVSKTARVVEEIRLKKIGSDHVETVRDKIGRQQVEIERLGPDGRPLTGRGSPGDVGSEAKEVKPAFFFALEGEGARGDEALWGKSFDLIFCYDVPPADALVGVKGERFQPLLRNTDAELGINVVPKGLTLTDGVAGRVVRFENGKMVGDPPRFRLTAPQKDADAKPEQYGVDIIFTISGSMIYYFFQEIRLVDQFVTDPCPTRIIDLDLEGIADTKVEEPRDLEVFIYRKGGAWMIWWRMNDKGRAFSPAQDTSLTEAQLNEEYKNAMVFDDLDRIAGDSIWKNIDKNLEVPQDQDSQDSARACLKTAAMTGIKLYDRFSADPVFKIVLNWIDQLPDGSRISIITDGTVFPWELFYPLKSTEGFPPKDIYPDRFWGHRFLMEWVLVGDLTVETLPTRRQQAGKLHVSMGLHSGIDSEAQWKDRPLLPVQLQKEYFQTSLRDRGEYFDRYDDIVKILGTANPASLIYFFCHGTADQLKFDNSTVLTADYARGEDYPGWPIIFINACEAGNISPLSFYSFRTKFRERKAAGVIAPSFLIPHCLRLSLPRP